MADNTKSCYGSFNHRKKIIINVCLYVCFLPGSGCDVNNGNRPVFQNDQPKEQKITCAGCKETDIKPGVYTKTDTDPAYPGGFQAWQEFVRKNINLKIAAKAPPLIGNYVVVVRFIVDIDSTVNDVKALNNPGYGMKEEAIRIIKKSGRWIPAIINRHPVTAYRKQPITFQITEK